MPTDPAHEALLNRIIGNFETRDADAVAALYEPDATLFQYPEVFQGREAIRESMADWFTAFPDTRFEIRHLSSSGDTFIAEGTFKGTHNGPMKTEGGEIPATGKAVDMPVCFVGRVSANGLLAEDRTYVNAAIMMEQLGLT